MTKQTEIYKVAIDCICFLIPTICWVLFRDWRSGLLLIFTDHINNSPCYCLFFLGDNILIVLNKVLGKNLKPSLIINSGSPLIGLCLVSVILRTWLFRMWTVLQLLIKVIAFRGFNINVFISCCLFLPVILFLGFA